VKRLLAIIILASMPCIAWGQATAPIGLRDPIRLRGTNGIFYSHDPTLVGDTDAGNLNMSVGNFPDVNLPGSARDNTVWNIGYNVSAIGTREDTSEPMCRIAWECFYTDSGTPVFEWHLSSMGADATERRPISLIAARAGTSATMQYSATTHVFEDWDGTSTFQIQPSSLGLYSQGLPLRFTGNNSERVFMRNAADSDWVGLPYIANDNRFRQATGGVFVGGAPTTGDYATYFMAYSCTSAAANDTLHNTLGPAVTGALFGYNTQAAPTTGLTNRVFNTNNANATAHATLHALTGGGSGGDPKLILEVNGGSAWNIAVDNDSSDNLIIASGSTPGTNFLRFNQSTSLTTAELPISIAASQYVQFVGTTNGFFGQSGVITVFSNNRNPITGTIGSATNTCPQINLFGTDSDGRIIFYTTTTNNVSATARWEMSSAGHLLASTDNSWDIGASGATRPRDVYVADDVVAGGDGTFTGAVSAASLAAGDTTISGVISMGSPPEVTIASGAVTVTRSYHTIDTEADAATDDLDTINGGVTGDILVLRADNGGRTVVVKDGAGIRLEGDMTLDHNEDSIMLFFDSGGWWQELSRSNGG
jgi:hypothetical protein